MRIAFSLIALLASVAAVPAAANSWRLASNGGDAPDRGRYYIDLDSVRRSGDIVDFTSMSVYEGMRKSGYNRAVVVQRGNCATMSSQSLIYKFYVGSNLVQTDDSGTEWSPNKEGSLAYGILMAACAKRAYWGDPTTDPVGDSFAAFRSSHD